jgi:hypothetical protein
MKSYNEISVRYRFLKGFNADAFDFLTGEFASEWAKLGLASKPFPVTRAILTSSDILTSSAFAIGRDKD